MIRNYPRISILLGFALVCTFVRNCNGSLFDADDALIVEVDDDQSSDEESTTYPPSIDKDFCITSAGLPGQCIKSRDCFPYLYLNGREGLEYEKVYTYGVAELIQNTTESCEIEGTTVTSNEPVKPGDELVCCVTLSRTISRQLPGWPTQQYPQQPAVIPEAGAGSKIGCGNTEYVLQDKIVGGREAAKGEFPWIVALVNTGKHFCGASLIDSKTAVTAAHCVNSLRSSALLKRITLHIGDHNLYTGTEVKHETRNVKRLVFHKKFNDRMLNYDIALLHLDQPVTFSNYIQPVCLHSGSPPYDSGSTNADVSGWGKIYEGGPQSQNLMSARIRVWTNAECSQKYQGTQAPPIQPGMVCAGTPGSQMKDSCQGDSGGPLTLNVNGKEHLVGIVSWGINCGQYPGVYTRVDKYLSWIQKYRAQ